MLLSEILESYPDSDVISITNEKEFERFSRTTSITEVPVCVFVGSEHYISTIPENATMVITTQELSEKIDNQTIGLCVSKNPKATYFRFFSNAYQCVEKEQIKTQIDSDCKIGKFVSIPDFNVKIGKNVVIEDFVTIFENVEIGDNCIIRSGARLGIQDYNFYNDENTLVHLPHYGKLIIEDNVEIGFNTVVGKALYPGDITKIGRGSKISNGCSIGHDCKIGNNAMIYAGSIVAGFVEIGENVHITLNSTVKNNIKIGNNVQINMGSVVIYDIPAGQTVFGNPARRIIAPR